LFAESVDAFLFQGLPSPFASSMGPRLPDPALHPEKTSCRREIEDGAYATLASVATTS